MVGFVDTAILVDILRQYAPAVQWFQSQQDSIGVCNIAYMELVAGSRAKTEQKKAVAVLKKCQLLFITEADMKWAIRQQLLYTPSHGIGMVDCLIAAPAARLTMTLYTRNLKHFTPLLGKLAQRPY